MSGYVLEAERLGKSFGAVVAAEDVSLAVPAGQRVCLIGSNGAGKTTFVNMVTGYLKPTSGTIRLDGQDITGLGPRQIAQRGVCRSFQIPQLCLELSAAENILVALTVARRGAISFWRGAYDADLCDEAVAMLERFGLAAHAERPVSELPGGVRKLLDIAMALCRSPRLMLLDEPTSGVSVDEKFGMMDTVLRAMDGSGLTTLFVEHDMDIVSAYSDRVVAFYSGRIIADGEPAAVLADTDVRRYVTGSAK
ncbi:MAG: ABC transporter ATP-binding protein [Ferrovibrio sp.]|jgi:branched-chain amino acid transport system ATP-binding protein|uniref:ABC transporter ATP-binding protein n=1 Tax=Ferrovibrio sp. TaxID=1917215 RepID=UPI00391AB260